MEDKTKKTDTPVDPEVENETPPEVPVEKNEISERKSMPNWLWIILAGVFIIVLLSLNYSSCSDVKKLEKAGTESKKQLDSLAKKTSQLESDLTKTQASLSELNDAFQDSLDKVNNPEWFRVADSLTYEYNNANGGVK